ncbi:PepSY-like domain-containing protein [Dyadobacter psychrotolerans]|uniref:Putative beta-lactamase-inhibitor-like PepSY-like domain-containing protein n=1 Tax=Dyadobacter psychrotolerans TaxID=2541721 RepID=A0A4R5DUC4_9BACT|nr:PepSY-like domain-containing protein [Dyadobacter psychrotolerans]TDE18136.1 hypothetical protein E0F88_00895 [Dyadobacter psychrotolerans]
MKNLLGLSLFLFLLTACESEKVVSENNLPNSAKEYVEAHFPSASIQQVVKERDDLKTSFDVILDNQVKLSFDKDGDCYDAEGTLTTKLPDSVIPLKVLEYVQKTYPDQFITDWEKDKTNQEIKLSSRLELVFNLSGGFLRIND